MFVWFAMTMCHCLPKRLAQFGLSSSSMCVCWLELVMSYGCAICLLSQFKLQAAIIRHWLTLVHQESLYSEMVHGHYGSMQVLSHVRAVVT